MTQPLRAFCRDHESWLLQFIRALVSIESPTDDKAAVDRCGAWLADELRTAGGSVRTIAASSAGDHLRVSFGRGSRQVMLLGHFDTVWPIGQIGKMPLAERDGRLHGPGVLDMKAGIGLATLATRAVMAVAPPLDTRIVMVWSTDEETGSRTSRALIEAEAARSAAVLVLEPALPGGVLKTRRKGCGQYDLTVHGVAAHAGVDPGKGVSAIRELARQVVALDALQDLERGVSVNVGLVSGGSRPNVVPDLARAVIDVRALAKADADRVDAAMRAIRAHLPGALLEVSGGFDRPPMERTDGVAWLYDQARLVGEEYGLPVAEGATGGGSDGNFTAALGIPTLDGLGALGDGAHALHEHVELDALVPRATLIAGLLARLCDSGA
jgi:glutamate carboxypeptidase